MIRYYLSLLPPGGAELEDVLFRELPLQVGEVIEAKGRSWIVRTVSHDDEERPAAGGAQCEEADPLHG